MSGKLQLHPKKGLKGEDGHQVFSVRLDEATISSLDSLAKLTHRSRNELINVMVRYALENVELMGASPPDHPQLIDKDERPDG